MFSYIALIQRSPWTGDNQHSLDSCTGKHSAVVNRAASNSIMYSVSPNHFRRIESSRSLGWIVAKDAETQANNDDFGLYHGWYLVIAG
jgi:hypothetical protein